MLLDRITLKKVNPRNLTTIQSGRYALIECDSKLGFEQGVLFEPLLPTSLEEKYSNIITFADAKEYLTNDEIVKEQQQFKIIFDAIKQINEKYEHVSLAEFSHFLPPEISKNITPNELDLGIEEAFKNGVLFQINAAPRMSMRYDTELLPTSRVKRYANNYQAHLVAHSECWQQRTVVGIIPKKLLAKVSEDEVAIYENIVYSRLIDHLYNYLSLYQLRLEEIVNFIGKFGALDGSGKDHRYIRQISEDWGRAFESNDVNELEKKTAETLRKVKLKIRKLAQLRSEKLYQSIPRSTQVPIELKQTNILVHDKNYRRAGKLWRTWLKNSNTERLSPMQILEKKQENFLLYDKYIAKAVRQIFSNLGWSLKQVSKGFELSHENTFKLTLQQETQGEWKLFRKQAVIARIITLSDPLVEELSQTDLANGDFLICPENNTLSETDNIIVISPIGLLGKEELAGKLQQQIIKTVIRENVADFKVRLPTAISNIYKDKHDYWLTDDELDDVKKHANKELYNVIVSKSHISKYLKQCPCCSTPAQIESIRQSSREYFTADCRNKVCKASWSYDEKKAEFKLNDGKSGNGRFSFKVNFRN
jgi:hypothetical protein